MAQQAIPATRNARPFLDFASRGLRYTEKPAVRTLSQRETKIAGIYDLGKITEQSVKRFERMMIYDEYRKKYQQVMKNQLKPRVIRKPIYNLQLDGTVRVDLPPEHPICRKREERRELMFATGKAGKGGQRPRRDNNDIKVRCEK